LQTRIDDFRDLETEILAISVDPVDRNLEMSSDLELEFPVLSDPELTATDAFGLRHVGGGPWGDIARPATFIVDRRGNVVWRDLTENWRVRPRPDDLLAVLASGP
jgi:peroxiredoxin